MTAHRADIAVVGMACRLPGASNPDELWRVMTGDVDPITEVPRQRWDIDALHSPAPATPAKIVSRRAGLLDDVERFDAAFFGIADHEAETMDPQQRIFLEICWAGLEDAGIAPDSLAASRTGVFLGAGTWDYNKILNRGTPDLDAGVLTGTILCVAANRVSHALDLHGPSLAVDSASSSVLVAAHLAMQSLRTHECDLALVGGVSLILSPETSIALSQNKMLSPDGRCKSFDANADGYARGEGCGVIVLKRLADAGADRDRVRAVVCGSAVNHNGRSNGLIAPRGTAQQRVMREALRSAGVAPSRIGYVEAHATGAALSDLMEAQAIKAVLSPGRKPEEHCAITSVDSCIGHLEQAAGIAKLIAATLSLEHETVARTHHLAQVHPNVRALFADTPFFATRENFPWPATAEERFAAVSSFGFGGTNAHLILREAPRSAPAAAAAASPELFTLRAKSETALRALAARHVDFLRAPDCPPLADICHTANTGRASLKYRLAIVASSHEELRHKLALEAAAGVGPAGAPRVVFVCGDIGDAARVPAELAELEPEFRCAVEEWETLLRRTGIRDAGDGLNRLLHGSGGDAGRSLAGIALNVALARLWLAWGVRPWAVFGCGTGEVAGACIAGAMSADDVLALFQPGNQPAPESASAPRPTKPAIRYVSASTGARIEETPDGATWLERAARPQRVAEAIQFLGRDPATLFLELAPGLALHECIRLGAGTERCVPSLRRDNDALRSILTTAGALFVRGTPLDLNRYVRNRPVSKVALPTYPFEGKHYWSRHPSARRLHLPPGNHTAGEDTPAQTPDASQPAAVPEGP